MYERRKMTEKDWELCNNIFHNFYSENSKITLKPDNWKLKLIENRYLLEEHNVVPFFNLLDYTHSPGLIIMPIMHEKDYRTKNFSRHSCIEFFNIPSMKEFISLSDEDHFSYTGGILLSRCNKIAAFCEVDNSILYLGFENTIEDEVIKNFPDDLNKPDETEKY
ncbi:hypothetical protein ACVWYN_001688 [Pedobacter sp. UYP24]